jgi:hypothetical protein
LKHTVGRIPWNKTGRKRLKKTVEGNSPRKHGEGNAPLSNPLKALPFNAAVP